MSDTIQFLESLGASATRLSPAQYAAAVAALDADADTRRALLDRNSERLATLLGGREQMWCALVVPQEGPSPDQEQDAECPDDDSDTPATQ